MTPFKRALKKYIPIMQSGLFTESDIRGFRKLINHCSPLQPNEKTYLLDSFYHHMPTKGYELTAQQKQKGFDYLSKVAFRKDGSPRETANYPFGEFEQQVLKTYTTFYFTGLEDVTENQYGPHYLPVYKCVGKKGNAFSYVSGSYRSGHNGIEIDQIFTGKE